MAAYGLDERFKTPKDCFRLTEPAAYDPKSIQCKPNKGGFARSPRNTSIGKNSYTDNIYNAVLKHTIPNVPWFNSKTPRFKYKPFTEEDLEEILCRCGIENVCECPTDEEPVPVTCQRKVSKRLYKGPAPHSKVGSGISVPSKRDHGFEILIDGSQRRILEIPEEECPPFYDARVRHFTEHYHGWKWSQWTGTRAAKALEAKPGPADYDLEKKKTHVEICAEKTREYARLASKQLRFVEALQRRSIKEGRPGPADYSPKFPQCPDPKYAGPKADRFPVLRSEMRPSPADHSIPRDFDLPIPPVKPCVAKLPSPACFGVKANRFKYTFNKLPGPADYDGRVSAFKKVVHYSKVPFGCSAQRFKEETPEESEDEYREEDEESKDEGINKCPKLTWQFKSKTRRFRTTKTQFDPYIPNLSEISKGEAKPDYIQALAPFLTSQGRFQPWFGYLPMKAVFPTPGPGYYNATKAKCVPAVNSGPLFRQRRFKDKIFETPAPNEYKIGGATEAVLKTHNKRLRNNLKPLWNKLKKPDEKRVLSVEERELAILLKTIRMLDVGLETVPSVEETAETKTPKEPALKKDMECYCKFYATDDEIPKQKLLRTFLHIHSLKKYF